MKNQSLCTTNNDNDEQNQRSNNNDNTRTRKRRRGLQIITIIFICIMIQSFVYIWDTQSNIHTIMIQQYRSTTSTINSLQQTTMNLLSLQQQQQQQQNDSIIIRTSSRNRRKGRRRKSSASTSTTTAAITTPTRRVKQRRPQQQQQIPQNRTITILLKYKGELGNHLSILANAYITQYITSKKYPYISYQFIGQHQNDNRWIHAAKELQKCFPNLVQNNYLIFDGGIHDINSNYNTIVQQQKKWLTKQQQLKLYNTRIDGINLLHRLLQYQQRGIAPIALPVNNTTSSYNGKYIYSLPYLVADNLYWKDVLDDISLYNEIRHLFTLDTNKCCHYNNNKNQQSSQLVPHPLYDIIYHHRNFNNGLSHNIQKYGTIYQELYPYMVGKYVFANYTTSRSSSSNNNNTNNNNNDNMIDIISNNTTTNTTSTTTTTTTSSTNTEPNDYRIAILSRTTNNLHLYQEAIYNTTQIQSYIVENNTGIQDFCFIVQSKQMIIGKLHSTFIQWSSLLSNSSINRFYTITNHPFSSSSSSSSSKQQQQNLVLDTNNNNNSSSSSSSSSSNSLMDDNNDNIENVVRILEHVHIDHRQFIFEEYYQPAP